MRRQVTHSSHDNDAIRKEIEGNYVYILDLVLICLSNIFYARMLRGGVKKQNHHKIKFEMSKLYICILKINIYICIVNTIWFFLD